MAEEKKIEETAFYIKGRRLLAEIIKQKKSVDDLGMADEAYRYIKNSKVKDENGKFLTTDEKFKRLGYPRNGRFSRDLRQELYDEILEYIKNGGSFHIERKSFPFYPKLRSYASHLKNNGKTLTHEEIIKDDLGFREYSELYYRAIRLQELKNYRDEQGFIDSYREDKAYGTYLHDLAKSIQVPFFVLITLIADEKLKECFINTDRISFVEYELNEYIKSNGDMEGISVERPDVFEGLRNVSANYSDGSGGIYTRKEMLNVLGFGDVENKLRDQQVHQEDNIEFEKVIYSLKQEYGNKKIKFTDLDNAKYNIIQRRAIMLNISIYELLKSYGIDYNGKRNVSRLSRCKVKNIPYLSEMKSRRDDLMNKCLSNLDQPLTKEELFEMKVEIVQQVYCEFKEQLENFSSKVDLNNEEIEAD